MIAATAALQNPIALLLLTGTLIGFNFPLGKLAGGAGVSPLVWTMVVSMGVAAVLLPVLVVKRRLSLPRGRMVRYVMVSGLLSFVTPNVLVFSAIPHVGSGYSGLMFALSPVFTLAFAMTFRIKGPKFFGVMGIALGLIGAVLVAFTRSHAPEAPPFLWIGIALAIPVVLAAGNVYRTLDWPDQAAPDVLAFWSHAFAVLVLLGAVWLYHGALPLAPVWDASALVVAQAVVAGLAFPAFFRLQRLGGPVLLSQIGYVAAAVSLLAATLFLGESYSALTWGGAAVIAAGICVTVVAQKLNV